MSLAYIYICIHRYIQVMKANRKEPVMPPVLRVSYSIISSCFWRKEAINQWEIFFSLNYNYNEKNKKKTARIYSLQVKYA